MSHRIVQHYGEIYVADVSPKRLAKARMANSVHDAGWSMLRSMLQYKPIARGAKCEIVSERYSSQVCSCCGTISRSRPKGIGGLGVRRWVCDGCGESHDRDNNAAVNILNILRVGVERRPRGAEYASFRMGKTLSVAAPFSRE
jgi:transposase